MKTREKESAGWRPALSIFQTLADQINSRMTRNAA
jgi:hypothetical protein